jgi:hypothetical protein
VDWPERHRRGGLDEAAQEVDLGEQRGARQRRLERQHQLAGQAVELDQVADQRRLVAGLAAHRGRGAQRPGAVEQGVGLAQLVDQVAQDLGVRRGPGGDHPEGLVDDLDLVAIQQVDRDHFGRLQHRRQATTVGGCCRGACPGPGRAAIGHPGGGEHGHDA